MTEKILEWHKQIDRDLPWKQTDDPYFIWLSEIIMQQTRVAQGTPYYLKFIKLFPTVHDLANASQEKVFKAWEGLGYYSRAKNLHATAKFISLELNGVFPKNYEQVLQLKGVGPYTAAAIVSFAYNDDKAVLDGNVFRVLSRLFDLNCDILSHQGKKEFAILAQELLPEKKSAKWNQAIMDFGALQCTPKKPNCLFCPVKGICNAYQNGTVHLRPVKKKSAKKKHRHFHFLDTSAMGFYLIEKRKAKDVWEGLYQFPLVENQGEVLHSINDWGLNRIQFPEQSLVRHVELKQTLSHQVIHACFYKIDGCSQNQDLTEIEFDYFAVPIGELSQYGFPRIITKYLGR